MKDAYSFQRTQEALGETYQAMYDAYSRIFTRLGLTFRAVQADTGAIGGNASHEFQGLAESGEDAIAFSDGSDYAANIEKAEALWRWDQMEDQMLRAVLAADAFKAGFRIPNILQNLFGEGVLSASFIPVYSRMLAAGDEESADMLAWAFGAILSLTVAALVAVGVAGAPYLIAAIAPGFHGAQRELTIALVRVLFPGAGLLVVSAWCLGVLNSHHRFFASYAAPVAWNLAIIAALLTALIALSSNKGFDFFFQDRGQDEVDCVPEFGL